MITIDLKKKSLRRDNKYLIKNGKPVDGYQISSEPVTINDIEILYHNYKYSIPDNIQYPHNYFKTCDYKEMSIMQLIKGENRRKAKENLETALLTGILNGSLKWFDDTKYFWQSKNDRDLILLKEWF